jgi:hypothetical protein
MSGDLLGREVGNMIIRELFRLLGFLLTLVLVCLMIGAVLGISLLMSF